MADRSDPQETPATLSGLFLRIWWMALGNAALLFLLLMMAQQRQELPSLLDAAFVVLVASLIVARLTDIRYFDGATAEGARATMDHFRRYAVRLLAISAAGWGVANAAAAAF